MMDGDGGDVDDMMMLMMMMLMMMMRRRRILRRRRLSPAAHLESGPYLVGLFVKTPRQRYPVWLTQLYEKNGKGAPSFRALPSRPPWHATKN